GHVPKGSVRMHLVAAVLALTTLTSGGTPMSVHDFKVKTIDGKEASLSKYKSRGFTVLGFPSNDFGAQEPGSNAEIKKFCELRYKTTFPLFSKIPVKG